MKEEQPTEIKEDLKDLTLIIAVKLLCDQLESHRAKHKRVLTTWRSVEVKYC
jgi:hypothetical protein